MNTVKLSQGISWTTVPCLLAGGMIVAWLWFGPARHNHVRSSPVEHTSGVRLSPANDDPDKSEAETDIDIIAIHGLDTKSPETWTWVDQGDPGKTVDWLRDQHMLPSKVGVARIFTCDWPASLFEQSDLNQKTIEEFARLLLVGIKRRPLATKDNAKREFRPLLFIGSCLGGIILMKALVMADNEYSCVRRATRGIIFLATPFRGTSFQDVAKWAEPALKAWASIGGRKVTNQLSNVKGPTFDLRELVCRFTQLCQDPAHPYEVMTFYEEGKTNLYRKVFPWLPDSSGKPLVDGTSGSLDIVSHPIPLHRPHITMNKFWGPEDPDYKLVTGIIGDFLRHIREDVDDWIRVNHYTEKRLEIIRLSNDRLSMEECYINLAIVEQLDENMDRSKERPKKGSEGDAAPQSSPFSRAARLKVKTPDKKLLVDLPKLFDSCPGPDSDPKTPRRILVRGRAGVGKTTLCKKIVHDFIHTRRWEALFSRVLWVPLRKLKDLSNREYNFGGLFSYIYFLGDRDGPYLADKLWRTIDAEATDSRGTLFILDGLDEVSELLDPAHAAFDFLSDLLNRPNVIITTRPHTIYPAGLKKPHRELETIGFSPEQVNEYLEKTVRNQQKISQIKSFLQKHQLIQDLVRIPIQLDALCITWDVGDFDASTIPETMTAVYMAIVLRLWRKDIPRLGKKSEIFAQKAHQSEIERNVKNEMELLGGFAFSGIHNNVIEFQPAHRDAMCKQFELDFALDEMLEKVSFLRTSDSSTNNRNRSYHFLHLTFQEYFAAHYFVQKWEAGQKLEYLAFNSGETREMATDPRSFLQQHKYTARYDMVWRFAAGLFKREANCFFNEIEKEPVDLLGPTHQRLVMHCLSELSTKIPLRERLEKRLSKWLLFECGFRGYSLLAREIEFPEQPLRTALETGSGSQRKNILAALQHSRAHLSDETVETLVARLKEDTHVRVAAIQTLGHQSCLSDTAVMAIVELLKDKDMNVRCDAAEALGGQSSLPNTAVMAIVELLKDEHKQVRRAAAEALGGQTNLPNTAVMAVVALLKDEHEHIRRAAAQVLKRQPNLPNTAVEAVEALLKDKDMNVRRDAAEAMEGQSSLPNTAVMAVVALLKDEHKHIRRAAAQVLKRQPNLPNTAVMAVVELLKYKDMNVRCDAAEALGGQTNLPNTAVEAIVELLKDKDMNVRRDAIQVLVGQSNLPNTAVNVIVGLLKEKYDNYIYGQALRNRSNLPNTAVNAIVALFKDKDMNVRVTAAEALGGQSSLPNTAVMAIVELLKDEHKHVRYAAAEALGSQSSLPNTAVMAVVALLKDEHKHIRRAAAQVLKRQPNLPNTAVEAVEALLKDKDMNVRRAAAEAMEGQSSLSNTAVMAIVELLKDNDKNGRCDAAEALGGQSSLSTTAVEAIVALLKGMEEDERAKCDAIQALGGQSSLPNTAVMAVVALLKDKHVRYTAAQVLKRQRNLPNMAVEAIVALLEGNEVDEWAKYYAIHALEGQANLPNTAVEAIMALLEKDHVTHAVTQALERQPNISNPDVEPIGAVRRAAAEFLRHQSSLSDRAVMAIVAMLKDKDEHMIYDVAGPLGGESNLANAAEEIEMLLKDKHVKYIVAQALKHQSNLPNTAVEAIVALPKDKHVKYTPQGLEGQSSLSNTAVEALVALLKDEHKNVRSAAIQALKDWPSMADKILDERLAEITTSAPFHSHFVKSLYEILLWRSFEEQLTWYVCDDGCHSTCIVNMRGELRGASIQREQFLAIVDESRQALDICDYSFW